jgi:hypothetical protein
MPDGTPAKNATLVAQSRAITNSAVHGHHAQANDNGEYRIELMQGQELFTAQAYVSTFPDGVAPSYRAVLEGKEIFTPLVSETKAFFCQKNQLTMQDFTLQEAFPLQGTVRYADGIPVKNAMVFISPKDFTAEDTRFQVVSKSGPIFSRGTGTDAEGKFRIYLPTFEYEVYVANGQGPTQTVEVGPDKTPMVELVMKNRNFVRPIRGDGSPLFQTVPQMAINMVFWRCISFTAEGKPTKMSIGSGGLANEEGNLEMCLEEGANLIFITNDDYTEGYAGEIPNNLKNLEVFPIQLVPLAQVQLRLVDTDGKPLSAQEVFCYANLWDEFNMGSGGLRVGDVLRTDENGLLKIPVPALGELKERFQYSLQLDLLKTNTDAKISGNLKFAPEKSGEILDVQEIQISR